MGGMLPSSIGVFLGKKCGIQVVAGLAPSNQTVGSLLITPWLVQRATKIVESNTNYIQFESFSTRKMMFANLAIITT